MAGPSLKVVLWKRVHRVENWVSNLFKYYFFFFWRSLLDGQAVRAAFAKRWVVLLWILLGWVGVGRRGASEGGRKKRSGLVRVWIKKSDALAALTFSKSLVFFFL